MTSVQQTLDVKNSMLLVRNLLRLSLSTVAYLRNFFEDDCFVEKRTSGGLRLKGLVAKNDEAASMIDWLEKGVFDALDKQYLKVFTIAVYEGEVASPQHVYEAYDFQVAYDPAGGAQLTVGHGSQQQQFRVCRGREEATTEMVAVMRRLVTLTQSLPEPLPACHIITFQLQYYDDRTPPDYEPPFFKLADAATRQAALLENERNLRYPTNLAIGGVVTPHHQITIRVRGATGATAGGAEAAANHNGGVLSESWEDRGEVSATLQQSLPVAALLTIPTEQFSTADVDALAALLHGAGNSNTTSVDHFRRTAGIDEARAEAALDRLTKEGLVVPSGKKGRAAKHFTVCMEAAALRSILHEVFSREDLLALLPLGITRRVGEAMGYPSAPLPCEAPHAMDPHVSVSTESKRRKI